MSKVLKNPLFWGAAILGLSIDRFTKDWVMEVFQIGESWHVWPGVFHFTFVVNSGAAFSLFHEQGEWLRWVSLLVSLVLFGMVVWGPRLSFGEQLGFGFIFSGALGNGIDWFASGKVIDFIDVRLIQFPIFNLADVFINIGVICLILSAFWTEGRSRSQKP
ncbi:MAG: signal peptidase II [Cyanobacteria bacterium LVE1205-1]